MNTQEQSFSISLGCDLMGEPIEQVLEQCGRFRPQLLTETPRPAFESIFSIFNAHAGFDCHFELHNYQAFSYVGINFVRNIAVECIVSLGTPADPERYRSELEVTKVFLASLEELYGNGRMQEETEPATRVYTWKKDSRTVISFVSSSTSGSPTDTRALLSVQIRDTQLHPDGAHLELLYGQAQKSVRSLKLS